MRRLLGSSIEYFERDLVVFLDQTRVPQAATEADDAGPAPAADPSATASAPTAAPQASKRQQSAKVTARGVSTTFAPGGMARGSLAK